MFLCDWSPADKVQPPTGVTGHASLSCVLFLSSHLPSSSVGCCLLSPCHGGQNPPGMASSAGGAPGTGLQISQTYFIVAIKLPDAHMPSVREERCIYLAGDLADAGPTGGEGCLLALKNSSVLAFASSPGQKGLLSPALYYTGVVWLLSHLGKLHTVGEVHLN